MGFSKALVRLEGWAQQFCAMVQSSYTRTSNAAKSLDPPPPLAALPVNVPGICPDYVRKSVKTQSLLIPKPL